MGPDRCPDLIPWQKINGTRVNLNRLTDPTAVRAAMREFDKIDRSVFLAKYGFRRAREYMLRGEDGRFYDSKAIAGPLSGINTLIMGRCGRISFPAVKPRFREHLRTLVSKLFESGTTGRLRKFG